MSDPTDQSPPHPRTSTDQLRTILTARLPADPKWATWIDGVVGELAGCVVEDPRLAQIRALCDESRSIVRTAEVRAILGAPPVDATPPQGIDRDALADLHRATTALALMLPGEVYDDYRQRLDRALALVEPLEGVALTPEEVEWLRPVLRSMLAPHPAFVIEGLADKVNALAARLEALS